VTCYSSDLVLQQPSCVTLSKEAEFELMPSKAAENYSVSLLCFLSLTAALAMFFIRLAKKKSKYKLS